MPGHSLLDFTISLPSVRLAISIRFSDQTMKIIRAAVIFLFCSVAVAQTTRSWEQSKYEEFSKGTAKGVAVLSNGSLELAPEMKLLLAIPSTYLWSSASDSQGNLFIAAGAPARVYRIAPDGKLSTVLAPQELQVQALTVNAQGTVYAATSPDGKIYKIDRVQPAVVKKSAVVRKGSAPPSQMQTISAVDKVELDPEYTSTIFYDPKAKYVWALVVDREGRLYVGTGDKGEIHRVEPSGTGTIFFRSDETHIRALALDPAGNLIAGSDGSGLIYRINPAGEAFVLYSAPKKEITALVVDSKGTIYAAAAGEKRGTTQSLMSSILAATASSMPVTPQASTATTGTPATPAATASIMPLPVFPLPGSGAIGSDVYRIEPDGSPNRLWTSRDDLVYALAIRGNHLLAGSGNKGKVFEIMQNGDFADLGKVSANQVAGFAPAPNGALYAVTSNLGKVFTIMAAPQSDGTYDSDVFDAKIFSLWGRLEVHDSGNIEFFTRTGNVDNPDRNWSSWAKVDLSGARIPSPSARFAQWRAVLHVGQSAARIDSVLLDYVTKNIAPEVEDVTVTVGNRAMPSRSANDSAFSSMIVSPVISAARADAPGSPVRSDSISVRWTARDQNEDRLSFSIYYRGDNETRWKLLKSDLSEHSYTFESNMLPDGGYTIKIVASDAPAHSPGDALTGEKASGRFEIDNTPPVISNLSATRTQNGTLHIVFAATDAMSPIKRAEFSIDARPWQFVAPVRGISDANAESYDFIAPLPEGSSAADEHTIVVRAYDRADNLGSAKAVLGNRSR